MPPPIPVRANALKQLLTSSIAKSEPNSLRPFTRLRQPPRTPQCLQTRRAFTSTPIPSKKGQKEKSHREESAPVEAKESKGNEDPHDFSTLEAGITKSLEKLERDLSKLRTGGRFNPELLENLKVVLRKDAKESFRLGDLAQVLPKGGRSIVLLVGEKEHIKPIVSAVQSAPNLNLQPQPDPHNPSQLNIAIPPPTKESRDLAFAAAKKAGDVAGIGLHDARAAMQKRLRAMELKKTARPDDLKKARKDMEKVVEKGAADVKKIVEAAKKAMES